MYKYNKKPLQGFLNKVKKNMDNNNKKHPIGCFLINIFISDPFQNWKPFQAIQCLCILFPNDSSANTVHNELFNLHQSLSIYSNVETVYEQYNTMITLQMLGTIDITSL